MENGNSRKIRVGLNGFGRIGRAFFRISEAKADYEIVAVNDIDPNIANHAYLLKYDSTYGRFEHDLTADEQKNSITVANRKIGFTSHDLTTDVPWDDWDIDVVVDATGTSDNVIASRQMVEAGAVQKVVITYAPREGVDLTLIFGVNEERYDPKTCQVISTSTCDANAVAPVLGILDQNFGIESGYVTTLHPWLPYQNLTDGSIRSVTSPTHFWNDFSLGRASTLSLLPKDTTLIDAIGLAMPDVAARLSSMSFRVPTTIVSASDMTITLGKETTAEGINMVLRDAARENGHIFGCGAEHLVSIDYLKTEQSFIADERWTQVIAGRTAKLILWYDNEWGYSNRVADAVELLASHFD